MAVVLKEGGLTFAFPAGWIASQYDAWSFYRHQFIKQRDGIQGVDFIAIDPEGTAYLIEVKDYRHPNTGKPSQLPEAIATKVLMTLAALLPCRLNGTVADEKDMASRTLKCKRLRVVVHIEQRGRRIPIVDPADLRMKLERMLRAVDAHPKVVSSQTAANLGWSVS